MKYFTHRQVSIIGILATLLLIIIIPAPLNAYRQNKHISIQLFEKSIDNIYKEIGQEKKFNAKNCSVYINNICHFIYNNGRNLYLPLTRSDQKRLLQRSNIILNKMFLLRVRLREKLQEFYRQGKLSKHCIQKIRMAFRYSRFTEEYLSELIVGLKEDMPKADKLDFSNHEYQLYVNPKYGKLEFKSGDMMMTRTSSFVSAVIARIGDEDGQFSHAAMIYIDNNGQIYVMESLIEEGVKISPFGEWKKKNHHARAVLFRYHDEKEGRNVANRLYQYIQLQLKSKGEIPYDFHMNDRDQSEIYCAELVQFGFNHSNIYTIPTFRSSYKRLENHPFLKELTIHTYEGFAPSDLEVEPHINLVAEWRNYDETRDARMEDAIQTKVLYWMSKKGYLLKRTPQSFLFANIGIFARKAFGIKKDLIPLNMPEGFLENIIKLYDLNKILEKYLSDLNIQYQKKYGYPMDYGTMMHILENLRETDCKTYKKEQRYTLEDLTKPGKSKAQHSLFHSIFNVENRLDCPLD